MTGVTRRTTNHPMTLDDELRQDLAALDHAALRRTLRVMRTTGKHIELDGQRLLNLAGNDYLGLAQHPRLIAAAVEAAQAHGVGAGASRLVTGTQDLHAEAERRFAAFKHATRALLLPTGYMANLAVLGTLARQGDLVMLDKINHASLIDAARASDAAVRTYPHLTTAKLDRLLAEHRAASPGRRRFIVTDSVFSMDGDCADLPTLCDLADEHDAVLVVDEAHATGVLGATGEGLAQHQGVADRVYTCGAGGVLVSTASKALGGLGGVVTGSAAVIDTLINHARPAIYTTAVPPAQAAALTTALDVVADEPERRQRLADLCRRARAALADAGWALPAASVPTPILPLIVGSAERALALANRLRNAGLLTIAIRPPTVAPASARVRLTLRADLTDAELDHALRAIGPA